jgi:hypothetical protein
VLVEQSGVALNQEPVGRQRAVTNGMRAAAIETRTNSRLKHYLKNEFSIPKRRYK